MIPREAITSKNDPLALGIILSVAKLPDSNIEDCRVFLLKIPLINKMRYKNGTSDLSDAKIVDLVFRNELIRSESKLDVQTDVPHDVQSS